MKDVIVSKCEHDFIRKAIAAGKRLDGRHTYDYRQIKVTFGTTRGSCQVHLGQTKVFAQVSCEVLVPKQSRPNEGRLFLNVELSPMAAPNFEAGRLSEYGLEVNRLLERCVLDSRAVDLESLCIVAGEKVWSIRVDVHVLNHDGNICDCASIAAISALSHFRRPDVTISGEDVTIHSLEDRHSVPLSVHHVPICVTFAFFDNGKYLTVDPTEREEQVMDGKMVVGMNAHREICTLHVGGTMSLQKEQIFRCTQIAAGKAAEITELIKNSLESDARKRSNNEKTGFVQLLQEELITTSKRPVFELNIADAEENASKAVQEGAEKSQDLNTLMASISVMVSVSDITNRHYLVPSQVITFKGKGTAAVGQGGLSTWTVPDDDDDEYTEDDVIHVMETVSARTLQPPEKTRPEIIDVADESEEDEVVMLSTEET